MMRVVPLLLTAGLLAGCGSEEMTGHDHTPATAALFVGGVDVTDDLTLAAGQVTEVEVRFFAADGDEIVGIEDEHYSSLVFSPGSLATAVYATGRHFLLEVTAQASAGTGTVTVGYGHDAAADELTFGPFDVTVQ
jgi:hypothetical protein